MNGRPRVLFSAIAACCALPLYGQPSVLAARACAASSVFGDSAQGRESTPGRDASVLSRVHPLNSRARYAPLVERDAWPIVLDSARKDIVAAFEATHVSEADRDAFLAQLDAVRTAVTTLPAQGSAGRSQAIIALRPGRFHVALGANPDGSLDNVFFLFRGRDLLNLSRAGMTDDQRRALCWSAMSVDVVLHRLASPLALEGIAKLASLDLSWQNYRTYGYTRQPLELICNRGDLRDLDPPRTQLLLTHLSAGVELQGTRVDSLVRRDAIVVEAGYLWYRSNWRQYSGVSAIASITSGSAAGYGALVHFARGVRAGWATRRTGGRWVSGWVLSTDAYGLFARSKSAVDNAWAAARGAQLLPKVSGP